jgi:hypothetical protein
MYPYIYDPTYQKNFTSGSSFLEQFGRDQQLMPGNTLPLTSMTAQGSPSSGVYFPNGVYQFFWLMKDYSPQVEGNSFDQTNLNASQVHWCVPGTGLRGNGVVDPVAGYMAPSDTTLALFPELTQLGTAPFTLPYACFGPNCCVKYLSDSIGGNAVATSNTIPITINGVKPPTPLLTNITFWNSNNAMVAQVNPGDSITISVIADETNGSIKSVSFNVNKGAMNSGNIVATKTSEDVWRSPYTIPIDWAGSEVVVKATAIDLNGVSVSINVTLKILPVLSTS